MAANKNLTTTSRIDHPVNVFYQKQFLKRLFPKLPHAQFGVGVNMPEHEGTEVKWRRMANPTEQTIPLIEGEDPSPVIQSKTDISATVQPYGAWLKESSWFEVTGISQHGAQRTKWLADQAARTIDTLCKNVISGTASSTTCSNGDPTATLPNKTDIDTVVQTMLGNNAEFVTAMIGAATGQGTSPIRASFIGIGHTSMIVDLENVSGFKHVANYAAPGEAYYGEYGSTGMVRWILTSDGYTSGSNYYCPILAEEAFGNVSIPADKKALIHHGPGEVNSPLEQYSTYGWKYPYVCRILSDALAHTLICTAS